MAKPKDDRFFVRMSIDLPGHRKLIGASPATKWLNVCGWIVARRELSDGFVRPTVVVAEAEVPQRHASDLVNRGLWHHPGHDCDRCEQPPKGSVVIHDYLEHQLSREQVSESRQKRSAAGKKGAESRWGGKSHSNSHDAAHQDRICDSDGKAMAEKRREENNVVALSSQSRPQGANGDGLDLNRIKKATRGGDAHARKTADFVLAKAPADVRNPTAYVLAAINDDPDAYRYRRGNPTKDTECREHAGEWGDACRQCALEQRLGDLA